MYIVDIVPLTKLPPNQPQILSYIHSSSIERGCVVFASIGKRKIEGLVVDCVPLRERKQELRKGVDFMVKKIEGVKSQKPLISEIQLTLIKFIARYYYTSLGTALKSILPSFFYEEKYIDLFEIEKNTTKQESTPRTPPDVQFVLSFDEIDSIPEDKNIFVLVPEISDVSIQSKRFSHRTPILFTSKISKKKYISLWQKVKENKEHFFIIGTRGALFLPYMQLDTIIILDESNELYKSQQSPQYHVPIIAHALAQLHNSKLIVQSLFPNFENFLKYKNISLPQRDSKLDIVDTTNDLKENHFSLISMDLKEELFRIHESKDRWILYIPRKGYASLVQCRVCGKTYTCKECGKSLVLYHLPQEHLTCRTCKSSTATDSKCRTCNSNLYQKIGAGIEKLEEKIDEFFRFSFMKTPPIFRIDRDVFTSNENELEVIQKFLDTSPSILIGTQSIFSYKDLLKAEKVGIINADALFHIPDFRSEERLLRDFLTLRGMGQSLLIQTKSPDSNVFRFLKNPREFVEEELEIRKLLHYPPFGKLVRIYYRHKDPEKAQRESAIAYEKLKRVPVHPNNPEISKPTLLIQKRGTVEYEWHIVLKFSHTNIQDRNRFLAYTPPQWRIEIDPKSSI